MLKAEMCQNNLILLVRFLVFNIIESEGKSQRRKQTAEFATKIKPLSKLSSGFEPQKPLVPSTKVSLVG